MSTRTALATLALALTAAGCGSSQPAQPGPAPDVSVQETTTTAAAGPGTSAENPAPIGMTVEPAKGWTVVVTAANLQGDAAMAGVNQFNKPQPGQRYVLVNAGIRNNSGKPVAPASVLKLSALANGSASMTDFTPPPAPKLDLNAQLQPGATAQGWIPFQVPAGAADVVLLAEPLLTLDEVKDQRFMSLT